MLKPLMDKYDSFIVTEKTSYCVKSGQKTYYFPQINRYEKLWFVKLLWIAIKSLHIYIKEKPDAIVCTGVLAMIPLCLICKIFGKKLIYIESFAKISSPTLSGKLLYNYADQFYVQWDSMKKVYPNAIYLGGIY